VIYRLILPMMVSFKALDESFDVSVRKSSAFVSNFEYDGYALCLAEYNSVRIIFTVMIALFFGTAFWQMGLRR